MKPQLRVVRDDRLELPATPRSWPTRFHIGLALLGVVAGTWGLCKLILEAAKALR